VKDEKRYDPMRAVVAAWSFLPSMSIKSRLTLLEIS
jgi:hypothetical protein